ncbi:MAG: saccharopine dehydrogenase NADP-binding domain-containing protein [Saprospiraceae bacterium]|nr:saccharopine dehydrogenase NADP-binding domain-containing protein [Saprospiraceae bacterium]
MHNILIIGAGRSSSALIKYVLSQAKEHNWFVTVADADIEMAKAKVNNHPNGKVAWLDVMKPNDRKDLIQRTDVVVSLLPAHLHIEVAQDCIKLRKHLITASYVSKEMYRLGDEAREKALIFMNELGLDPGIDHMSAMQKIHEIKAKGGKLLSFSSYAGGLVAPENDDNPWHYKFSWNPRNVILAGQGTAQFLEDNKLKYIPYRRLFRQYKTVDINGMGEYEAYANRDSLWYKEIYGLDNIPNLLRGTLRHKGFCDAWNALIRIGLTDNSFPILGSDKLTFNDLMEAFLGNDNSQGTVKERIARMIDQPLNSEIMNKIEWLGLFSRKKIKLHDATPAQILESLLLDKWALQPEDKDMVIMQHEFIYELKKKKHLCTSTLVMKGENSNDTAMSKLVGLPLGIFTKLVMLGKINAHGVHIPVMSEVYNPVLKELEEYGVIFKEKEVML